MIQADKLVATQDFQSPTSETRKSEPTCKASKPKIAEAMRTLQGMNHVHCKIGDTDFRLTWEPTFNMMTDAEIDKALIEAQKFTGFLKPGHLLEWGQKLEGMPSLEEAYRECCDYQSPTIRKPLSHPGLYSVMNKTGCFELKTQTREKCLPRFKGFYEDMVYRVKQGEVFKAPESQMIERKAPQKASTASRGYQDFLRLKESLHSEVTAK